MRYLLSLLLVFFITSCSNDRQDNDTIKEPFSIKLASGLAPKVTDTVPVNSRIILDINTSLNTATVNDATIYIHEINSSQKHPINVLLQKKKIIIKPIVYLNPTTHYEVVVTTNVKTITGAQLSKNHIISFLTESAVDFDKPQLIVSLPLNGQYSVREYTNIILEFDEPLSPLSIDTNTISLKNIDFKPIPCDIKVSGALISCKPLTNLPDGNYSISVNSNTIKDLAGNIASPINNINFNVTAREAGDLDSELIEGYDLNVTINNITSENNILFTGTEDGLYIIKYNTTYDSNYNSNLDVNTSFTFLSHLSADILGSVYDIDTNLTTSRVYIASNTGISIVDISNINTPKLISFYPTKYPVYGIDANSTRLYVAASLEGFLGFDITDEKSPQLLFTRPTTSSAFDVKIYDLGYMKGLILSDYANGIIKATVNGDTFESSSTPSPARQLTDITANNYFYVATGTTGASRITIDSTLSLFSITSTIPAASYVTKMCLGDNIMSLENDLGINDNNSVYSRTLKDIASFTCIASTKDMDLTFIILAERNGKLFSTSAYGY